jgi:thiol-disulfide isomerase/thioredoxin
MLGFAGGTQSTGPETPEGDRNTGLKRVLAVWALIGLAALVAVRTAGRWRDRPPTGYVWSNIALSSLDGEARPLPPEQLQGKVLLVNFWATWCGPCVEEFPDLLRIADGYRNDPGFKFLSVSTGHGDWSTLRTETAAFLRARGYDVPVYADPQGAARAGLQGVDPGVVPVTVLVDREGKVAQVCVGFDPPALDEMQLQIATLLAKAPQ